MRAMRMGMSLAVCVTLTGSLLAQPLPAPKEAAPKVVVEVGRELSNVVGTSIVRRPDRSSGVSASAMTSSYFHHTGTLAAILEYATGLPSARIVGTALLPEGTYDVKVRTRGEPVRAVLLFAVEQAFGLQLRLENKDVDVLLLTRTATWARDGFPMLETRKRIITITYDNASASSFSSTDGKTVQWTEQGKLTADQLAERIEEKLKQKVINDTMLAGRMQIQFSYRGSGSLADYQQFFAGKGLALTPSARSYQFLTIEPARKNVTR